MWHIGENMESGCTKGIWFCRCTLGHCEHCICKYRIVLWDLMCTIVWIPVCRIVELEVLRNKVSQIVFLSKQKCPKDTMDHIGWVEINMKKKKNRGGFEAVIGGFGLLNRRKINIWNSIFILYFDHLTPARHSQMRHFLFRKHWFCSPQNFMQYFLPVGLQLVVLHNSQYIKTIFTSKMYLKYCSYLRKWTKLAIPFKPGFSLKSVQS